MANAGLKRALGEAYGAAGAAGATGGASKLNMKKYAAIIILAGLLAYLPSFKGVMLLDDFRSINADTVGSVHKAVHCGLFRSHPLVGLSFVANWKISGDKTWSYHEVNLLIHLLAGLFLLGIIRRTLLICKYAEREALWLAMLSAILWTIHPLNTQAVTYIVQRTECLMGMMYLATVYCLIRGWLFFALCACAAGMGCKEVMLTAPLMALLYDRTFLSGTFKSALRRRWLFYPALFTTAAFPIWAHFTSQCTYGAGFKAAGIDPLDYAATETGVILHYLRLAVLPIGQCFDYGWPVTQSRNAPLFATNAILTMLAMSVWLVVRRPAAGFLAAWFFSILAITSSFVPIIDPAFEQRMYLSLVAVIVGVILAGHWGWNRLASGLTLPKLAQWRLLGWQAAILAVLALSWGTWTRNMLYCDNITLYGDAVSTGFPNARARSNYGLALMGQGRFAEAEGELRTALQICPTYWYAAQNLATTLIASGKSTPWDMNNVCGLPLMASGKYAEAETLFREAVRIDPKYWAAWFNIGKCAQCQGHYAAAVVAYRESQTLNPKYPQTGPALELALSGRQP